jgi:phosphoglycerol transferase
MIESFYFFVFSILAYNCILLAKNKNRFRDLWLLVISNTLILATQPKGLICQPALFYLLIATQDKRNPIRKRSQEILVYFICVIILRQAIGFIIAGKASFTFLGSFYSSTASKIPAIQPETFISDFVFNFWGALLALVMLFSLPLYFMIVYFTSKSARRILDSTRIYLNFIVIIFATHVLFTSMFAAATISVTPYELIARVTQRYYDFLFPLLLVAAFICSHAVTEIVRTRKFLSSSILVFVNFGIIWFQWFDKYLTYGNDSPEIAGLRYNSISRQILILNMILLILAVIHSNTSRQLFVLVLLPALFLSSGISISSGLQSARTSNQYTTSVQILKTELLKFNEIKPDVLFISSDAAQDSKILFDYDSFNSRVKHFPEGSKLELNGIPGNFKYVVVIGNYSIDSLSSPLIRQPGIAIFKF